MRPGNEKKKKHLATQAASRINRFENRTGNVLSAFSSYAAVNKRRYFGVLETARRGAAGPATFVVTRDRPIYTIYGQERTVVRGLFPRRRSRCGYSCSVLDENNSIKNVLTRKHEYGRHEYKQ